MRIKFTCIFFWLDNIHDSVKMIFFVSLTIWFIQNYVYAYGTVWWIGVQNCPKIGAWDLRYQFTYLCCYVRSKIILTIVDFNNYKLNRLARFVLYSRWARIPLQSIYAVKRIVSLFGTFSQFFDTSMQYAYCIYNLVFSLCVFTFSFSNESRWS